MIPDDDFKDFLAGLSAARVRHLIVGAYALAAHGHLRATGGLDVWVESTNVNVKRLGAAIRAFADTTLAYFNVTERDLVAGKVGFFMGIEPARIDVHTTIAGLTFKQAWRNRMASDAPGMPIDVLGLADLIVAKRASLPERSPGSIKAQQDATDLAWLAGRARRIDGPRRPPLRRG